MRTKSKVYVNSVIHAIEPKLITEDRLIRLLDTKSLSDAMRVLAESGYGEGASADGADYQKVLLAEDRALARLVRDFATDDLAEILLLYREYHNAKVLVKAKYARKEADASLLYEDTVISPQSLKERLDEDDYEYMRPWLRTALEACDEVMALSRDPMRCDVIMDRAYYAELFHLLKGYNNAFLTDYYRTEVDLINLGTVARCKRLGLKTDFLRAQAIRGGVLGEKELYALMESPAEGFLEILRFTPYRDYAEVLASSVTEGPVAFEREKDNVLLKRLLSQKNDLFSEMPLICYVMVKRREITNVRLILVAKASGTDLDEVRVRLRATN